MGVVRAYLYMVHSTKAPNEWRQSRTYAGKFTHTRVASANKNPGSFIWSHIGTFGHRQYNVVCEVDQVVDGLLDCVYAKTFYFEIGIRITEAIEAVLKDNGCSVGCLR